MGGYYDNGTNTNRRRSSSGSEMLQSFKEDKLKDKDVVREKKPSVDFTVKPKVKDAGRSHDGV